MTYPYEAALYAERNRNEAYKAIISALEEAVEKDTVTRRIIADRIGRKAPQVSKWLSGPSNWTLDTISDLLFAIGATVDYNVVKNLDRPKQNEFNEYSTPISISSAPSQPAIKTTLNVSSSQQPMPTNTTSIRSVVLQK